MTGRSGDGDASDHDDLTTNRRGFLQAGVLSLAGLGTGTRPQLANPENPEQDYPFRQAAHLIGDLDDRPAPGSAFFENKIDYAYVYEDFSGTRYLLEDGDTAWNPLNAQSQTVVTSVDDLPAPSGGTHTLADNTVYIFNGFITSSNALELGTATPLIGRHGSADGFIYVGGGTALQGTDAGFFARDMYFHSPGGTMFGLSATPSTEMLVESCSFSDAAGIGDIASLGTISGYRVPSFKGCNFEDFADGFTWDGSPDKIFFEGCPFRDIDAANVTIHTLASTLDVDIWKLSTDCYVKDVQTDTEVIRVEAGGEPANYLKIINADLTDPDLQRPNILVGALGERDVGVIVADSFPLEDSGVTGDLDLDSPTTVTGSGAAPTQIDGPTTLTNIERTDSPSNGVIRYIGKSDTTETVHANVAVSGANTQFALYIAKNGTVINRTEALGFLPNSSAATGVTALASLRLSQNDTVSAWLENIGGTKDLTAEAMDLTV